MSAKVEVLHIGSPYEDQPADVLLYAPHTATSAYFERAYQQEFEDLLGAISVNRQTFKDFLGIEQEREVPVFLNMVAQFLSQHNKNLQDRVRVITVQPQLHRGIIDLNWNDPEMAIRNTFDKKEYPDLYRRLKEIRAEFLHELADVLERYVGEETIVGEIHSMAPYNPLKNHNESPSHSKALQETPENLERYLQQYLEAGPEAEGLRKLCIITNYGKGTKAVADEQFCTKLSDGLDYGGIPYVYNEPYALDPRLTSSSLMELFPGRVHLLDIPKTYLAISKGFDLRRPLIDQQRIFYLAKIYEAAMLSRLGVLC